MMHRTRRWSPFLPLAWAVAGCASSAPPAPCTPAAVAPSVAAPSVAAPSVAAPSVAAPSVAAPPQDGLEQQTSEQLAHRVMELTGAGNLGKQIAAPMAEQMKKLPNMPPGFMDRFMANIHPEELTDLIVPIYVKELDHDTLVAVVRFYQTQAGKLLVGKLPILTQESMEAGKAWGSALARKTFEDLDAPPPKAP